MAVEKLHKEWSSQKKKLSKETQAKLKKKKKDLGPNLDKYVKVATACSKDLATTGSKTGKGTKASKFIDAAMKLEKLIDRACDDYLDIVDGDNTKEERDAEKLLKKIQKEVASDLKGIKGEYAKTFGATGLK